MPKKTSSNGRRGRPSRDADVKRLALSGRRETTYQFPDGSEVTIWAVAAPLVYDIQSDAGKPAPETFREIKMAGGGVMKMPDTKDPAYQNALREWEIGKAVNFARTIILEGVKDWPPDDEIAYWMQVGVSNPVEIKFRWIARKLINQRLEQDFYQTVMGLSMPTEDGVEDAEAAFPGAVPEGGQLEAGADLAAQTEAETAGTGDE